LIRSVLGLRAREGRATALEEFYRERGVLERARQFPGCLGTTFWRTAEAGTTAPDGTATHIVIADWNDASDYRAWVSDPWRSSLSVELADLIDLAPGQQIVGYLLDPVDVPATGSQSEEHA
jgi:heme-degrading monooxygenase HmoA